MLSRRPRLDEAGEGSREKARTFRCRTAAEPGLERHDRLGDGGGPGLGQEGLSARDALGYGTEVIGYQQRLIAMQGAANVLRRDGRILIVSVDDDDDAVLADAEIAAQTVHQTGRIAQHRDGLLHHEHDMLRLVDYSRGNRVYPARQVHHDMIMALQGDGEQVVEQLCRDVSER